MENLGGRMKRMKKRGPNVLFDLNDLLFFLTWFVPKITKLYLHFVKLCRDNCGPLFSGHGVGIGYIGMTCAFVMGIYFNK